ncbi:PAS domain-containing protein [Bradyrhizobium sp. NBAIM20]|uniref:PAS domain-containing protein n=1 Tax=unclassified Bradyrhizobium TaxID=2631580 RepID=UPI001CD2D8A3|nr:MULTISPECIES: PAS domain-containing protein [unclassified Bradyrhizobium]MCA1411740.1 PAS domain-containing protein [Bradyrhizobium sp. NBAIM20]MCA1460925.1 PAS domain-containing protein [Bradyrhizobium sp. NBAIM18]
MTSTADSGPLVKGVDDVLITAELSSRASSIPDYEAESRALGLLAQKMATNPRGVLQKCAELVMELCHADSAGISILEPGGTGGILRWHAAAGRFAPNLHRTMPQEASPCGTVMERNSILLFNEAERFFPALRDVEPQIYENLLAPWHVKGKAVGTIWAIKHTPEGRFDAEDARVLQSLARFAAAAFQMTAALDEATAERNELEQRTKALHASEARLAAAIDLVGLSPYAWNPTTGALEWDVRLKAMWGLPPDAHVDKDVFLSGIHPEDRRRVETAIAECIDPAGSGLYAIEYRVIGIRDGIERWVFSRGRTVFENGQPIGFTGAVLDITTRKLAEEALHLSGERQAFLLKLSDALRPLANPFEIKSEAARVLGRHLGAGRAAYADVEADGSHFNVDRDYTDDVLSFAGRHRFESFGRALVTGLRAGRTVSVADAERDGQLDEAERAAYAAGKVRAAVAVPLVKGGRLSAVLFLHFPAPQEWTAHRVALVEETAERTWAAVERARAEASLRESEERFRQFADASAAGLWIRDANSLEMDFASPAIGSIYGVLPDESLGNVKRWAALVVPDDRDEALTRLEAARGGQTVIHEFRIQRPSDGAFRWIRNTDFPLEDADGRVQRVGGIAEDITVAKLAIEHQGVLLAELQHRVRNIMAVIRSMALRTADGAADVTDYRSLLEGRLLALARVQSLLIREANAGGSLREIIASEVSAQARRDDQFDLDGPEIRLSPKAVEVLTLAFHELATNALKYGAFSVQDGRVRVSWKPFEKRGRAWLALEWTETGTPPREPSKRRGFGSDLIEGRIPYELGGTGKINLGLGSAHCRMEFPLKEGESILETDAPTPVTIFGGTLDMTNAPDLTGRKVLVVEDDYYIAGDTAAALRGAGAEVLGPCPDEDATLELLGSQMPTHAVLDLNLGGGGPKFAVARLLKERGVPFVFLTGYDPNVIQNELADVVRLQKPIPQRKIVEAVADLKA